ncbi:hypothetical protein QE152_g38002 [Popillia japonica]|uniref:Uncharacterized protein n=1 Tax=Popillia japonica TaxID=7064 RepID=A0AAW1I8G0_POPJA
MSTSSSDTEESIVLEADETSDDFSDVENVHLITDDSKYIRMTLFWSYIKTNEHVGDIYQDEANQAAILLRNDASNGALIVEGSIGSDLVIRPLPQRLRPLAQNRGPSEELSAKALDRNDTLPTVDDEMFLDAGENLSDEVAIDTGFPIRQKPSKELAHKHIVYKRKQDVQEDAYSDYAFMEPDHMGKRYKRNGHSTAGKRRTKREAPYTIFPEILVIVDYDGYRLHGGDNLQIKRDQKFEYQ